MARERDRVNFAIDEDIPGFDKSNIPGSRWSKTLLEKYSASKQNECYVIDDLPLEALKRIKIDPSASNFQSYLRLENVTEREAIKRLKDYYVPKGVRVEVAGEEPLPPTKVKLTGKEKSLPKENWSKVKGKYDDSINKLVLDTMTDGREHGRLTGPDGSYLGIISGTKDGMNDALVAKLLAKARMKGCILTHTHPQDGNFSKDDIFLSLTNKNIGISRVVNSSSAFQIRRTDTTKFLKGTEAEFEDLSKIYDKSFRNSFRGCLKTGKYSEEDCFRSGTYSATSSVSKAYGLEFKEIKPVKEAVKVEKPVVGVIVPKHKEEIFIPPTKIDFPPPNWSAAEGSEPEFGGIIRSLAHDSIVGKNSYQAMIITPDGHSLGSTKGSFKKGLKHEDLVRLLNSADRKGFSIYTAVPKGGAHSKELLIGQLTNPNVSNAVVISPYDVHQSVITKKTKFIKGTKKEIGDLSEIYDNEYNRAFGKCSKGPVKLSDAACYDQASGYAAKKVADEYGLEFKSTRLKVIVESEFYQREVPLEPEDWSEAKSKKTVYGKSLLELQKYSEKKGVESACILDGNYNQLGFVTGTVNSISGESNDTLLARGKGKGKDLKYLHTHPWDGAFSNSDLVAFLDPCWKNVDTMVAATANNNYEIVKTAKSRLYRGTKKEDKTLIKLMDDAYNLSWKYCAGQGNLPLRECYRKAAIDSTKAAAEEYGLIYREFGEKEAKKAVGIAKPVVPVISPASLRKVTSIPKEYNKLSVDDQIVDEPYFAMFPDSIVDKKKLVECAKNRPSDSTVESTFDYGLMKCIKRSALKKTDLSQGEIRQLLLTPGSMFENHPDIYMKFKDSTGIDPIEFQRAVIKTYQKDMPTEDYRFIHYGNASFRKSFTAPNATPKLSITDSRDIEEGLGNGVYFRATPNVRDAFEAGSGFEHRPVAIELNPKWVKENRLAYLHDYDKAMYPTTENYNRTNEPMGGISKGRLKQILKNKQNEAYILDNIPASALKQVTINPNAGYSGFGAETREDVDASIKKLTKHYEDMGIKVVILGKVSHNQRMAVSMEGDLVAMDEFEYAQILTPKKRKAHSTLPEIHEEKPEIIPKKVVKRKPAKEAVDEGLSIPSLVKDLDKDVRDYITPYLATLPDSIIDKEVMIKAANRLKGTATLDSICESSMWDAIKSDITRKTGLNELEITRILLSPAGAKLDVPVKGKGFKSKLLDFTEATGVDLLAERKKAIKIIQKNMPADDYKLVHYSDNIFNFDKLAPPGVRVDTKADFESIHYGYRDGVFTKAVSNKDDAADPNRNFGKRGIIVEIDPKWVKENRIVNFHGKPMEDCDNVNEYNENAISGSKITKAKLSKVLKNKANAALILDNVPPEAISKVVVDPNSAIWDKMIGYESKTGLVIDSREKAIEIVKSKCKGSNIKFEILKKGAISSPREDKKLADAMEEVRQSIKKPKAIDKDVLTDKYPSLGEIPLDIINNEKTNISKQYTKIRSESTKDVTKLTKEHIKDPASLLGERSKADAETYLKTQQVLIDKWQTKGSAAAKKKLFDKYKKLDDSALATVAYSRACFKKAHPKGATVYMISEVPKLGDIPAGKSSKVGIPQLTSVIESEDAAFLKIAELKKKGVKASLVKTTIQEKDVYWDSRFGGNDKSRKDGEIMVFPSVKEVTRVLSTKDVPKEPGTPVKVRVAEVPQKLPVSDWSAVAEIDTEYSKPISYMLGNLERSKGCQEVKLKIPGSMMPAMAVSKSTKHPVKDEDFINVIKKAKVKDCTLFITQPSGGSFTKDEFTRILTNPNISTAVVVSPTGLHEVKTTKKTKSFKGTKKEVADLDKVYEDEFKISFDKCTSASKFSSAQCFDYGTKLATQKVCKKYSLDFAVLETEVGIEVEPKEAPVYVAPKGVEAHPWKEESVKPFSTKKLKTISMTPKEFLDLNPQEQALSEPYFALAANVVVDKKIMAKEITKSRSDKDNSIEGFTVNGIKKGIKKSFLKKSGLSRDRVKQILLAPGSVYMDDIDDYKKFTKAAGYDPLELQSTVAKAYQKDMPTEDYRFVHYGGTYLKEFNTAPSATEEIGSCDYNDEKFGIDNGVFFRAVSNKSKAFEPGRGFEFFPVAIELDPKWVKENRIAFMGDVDPTMAGTLDTYNRVNTPAGATTRKDINRILENKQNEVYIMDNVPLKALKQVTINQNAGQSFLDVGSIEEKEDLIAAMIKHYEGMGVKVQVTEKMTEKQQVEWTHKEEQVIYDECKKGSALKIDPRKEFEPKLPEIIEGK